MPRSGRLTHSRQPRVTLFSVWVGGVVLITSVVSVDIRGGPMLLLLRGHQLHTEGRGMATGIYAGMGERNLDTLLVQCFLDGYHHATTALEELVFGYPERKLQIHG